MYLISVRRDFIAQHFLIGGDWGPENQLHSHPYQVEVQLEGESLNQHGYLVDILQVEAALDAQVARFKDKNLNEMPEFSGLNPSLEQFSRILCQAILARLPGLNLRRITLRLWENENAWAAYLQEL